MNSDPLEEMQVSSNPENNPDETQRPQAVETTPPQEYQTPAEIYREETAFIAPLSVGLEEEDWANAESYLHNGEIIELEIIDQNRGGLIASFGQLRGFIPNSHIPELKHNRREDQAFEIKKQKIGTWLPLLVIEADKESNRLIFSAKPSHEDQPSRLLGDLRVGETITGQVVNLVKFGAFVDVGGGINGLIHISELSWQRINHPDEVVRVGDEVTIEVQEINLERERVSLSLKSLQPNPWDSIEGRYKVGNLVEGVVTTVRSFGIFLELAAGVEGLLHESEFTNGGLITSPEAAKPGDKLLVRITSIQPEQQRIGLSLQQVTMEDQLAWLMHRDQNQQAREQPSPNTSTGDEDAPEIKPDGREEIP